MAARRATLPAGVGLPRNRHASAAPRPGIAEASPQAGDMVRIQEDP